MNLQRQSRIKPGKLKLFEYEFAAKFGPDIEINLQVKLSFNELLTQNSMSELNHLNLCSCIIVNHYK